MVLHENNKLSYILIRNKDKLIDCEWDNYSTSSRKFVQPLTCCIYLSISVSNTLTIHIMVVGTQCGCGNQFCSLLEEILTENKGIRMHILVRFLILLVKCFFIHLIPKVIRCHVNNRKIAGYSVCPIKPHLTLSTSIS